MFEQMKRFTAYIQFEFAFQKHERSQKKAHLSNAEIRYSTAKLEDEVSQISAQIAQEIQAEYGARRNHLVNNINEAEFELSQIGVKLSICQRNYKGELQPIYDELEDIKEDLQSLHEAKTRAYSELNSAKSLISSWHTESDGYFFGNRGKKIPQKSFFGQSLDDLQSYKRRRDNAHYEIGAFSDKIAHLKSEKEELRLSLGAIKQDRNIMNTLRNEGLNSKILTIEFDHKNARVNAMRKALTSLETKVHTVTLEKQKQYGLLDRREKIQSSIKRKSDFIASFFTDQAKSERRVQLKKQRMEATSL